MGQKSIALFTWGLVGDSFTHLIAALCTGFRQLGVEELYVLHLEPTIAAGVHLPAGVQRVWLGARRARSSPLALARFLREVEPDVLIAMPAFINMPAVVGRHLAGRLRTRLVVSEHATMSYKAYVEQKSDLRMRLQPWLARWLYPKADGLVANGPDVLEDLLGPIGVRMPAKRAVAIAPAVDLQTIRRRGLEEADHPWLRHKRHPVVLGVGRLVRQKNFALLLRAFALVRRDIDARLIVLGEGSQRQDLERLTGQLKLDQNVSLPGNASNPWSSMARADVFASSSEEEAFGLVLVEAMASGLPVVATDALGGGPRTILAGGRHGELVAADDAEALAAAICRLLTSKSDRARSIDAGFCRSQAFEPTIIARQWLDFFDQLDEPA